MRMPVIDGWGFMRALREGEYQPQILVMSAAHDARRWADEVGAAGHVPKPFEADDLLAAVKRALDDSRSLGSISRRRSRVLRSRFWSVASPR
jgi:CheY-like chemotaxis protein